MYKKSFFARIKDYDISKLILSYDTFVAIITFFLVLYFTKGVFDTETVKSVSSTFIQVSAGLFGIILAGLAIVTSFTDKDFVYAWKAIGEFDNMITLFQYNLFVPLIIIVLSMFIQFIYYNNILFMVLIAGFVYMLGSLIDLINFISRYGLQRGEFVKQLQELDTKKKK